MNRCSLAIPFLLSAMFFASNPAVAGSGFATGDKTPVVASVSLDLTIIIPKFVYLRVGSGSEMADNLTVDNLVFAIPAERVGDGTAVPAQSGDVVARVMGNSGSITFSSQTQGAMSNEAGDTISYSDMTVTVAPQSTGVVLAHPPLSDGTSNSISLPTTDGNVTDLDARWTFAYANVHAVPAGTYGGVNQRNGRVNYSVSIP